MRASPEMQSAWTDCWKSGPTESLPQDRAAGRLAALDSTWATFFSGLPDGAKLLDLATGGGDVIRQAIRLGKRLEITGVDIADLAAVRPTLPAAVHLIGDTDLSALPFPDSTFDGVASQFGFEYADVTVASQEAIRVLVRGGRGCFVMHHADSAITEADSSSLAAYRQVFEGSAAFDCGKTVFELLEKEAPSEVTAEAEAQFRNAVRALQYGLREDQAFRIPRGVVGFLGQLASSPRSYPASAALARLDLVERQNEARNRRKAAQTNSALDRQGITRVRELLERAGARVEAEKELRFTGGRILAWTLAFQK